MTLWRVEYPPFFKGLLEPPIKSLYNRFFKMGLDGFESFRAQLTGMFLWDLITLQEHFCRGILGVVSAKVLFCSISEDNAVVWFQPVMNWVPHCWVLGEFRILWGRFDFSRLIKLETIVISIFIPNFTWSQSGFRGNPVGVTERSSINIFKFSHLKPDKIYNHIDVVKSYASPASVINHSIFSSEDDSLLIVWLGSNQRYESH